MRFFAARRYYSEPMFTDAKLLRRYIRDHDEQAFAEFVQRHVGLVYAAALRRTNSRSEAARGRKLAFATTGHPLPPHTARSGARVRLICWV